MTSTQHDASTTPQTTPSPEPRENFIAGRWTPPSSGQHMAVISPRNGAQITTVPESGAADIDVAVQAARRAADAGVWSGISARERGRILVGLAALIRQNADELAELESADVGKPISLARAADVPTAADHYEYYGGLAQLPSGVTQDTAFNALAYTRRVPLGVVAAITPFNFPLILSSTKIAPALATGNTVVHKPADDTPLTALYVAELAQRAGVPDGVLNVVTGTGPVAGEALLRHPGVDKIAFTGSTAVGRHAAEIAGSRLIPATMELGGNGAHIIFADADLEKAIQTAIKAFIVNTGQYCMSGPRLLVAREIYDIVLDALAQAVPTIPVGDPRNPDTVVGPMAAQRHLTKVEEIIAQARADGGRIVCGGERIDLDGGFYLQPTVLTDVPASSTVMSEEIFGPVLTVTQFDTEEEAISIANGTAYGLAAGLQTRDITRAHRVAARLRAGIVWINDWALLDASVPFGGFGASGFGRESGPEALLSYTATKSVVVSLDEPGR